MGGCMLEQGGCFQLGFHCPGYPEGHPRGGQSQVQKSMKGLQGRMRNWGWKSCGPGHLGTAVCLCHTEKSFCHSELFGI
jgi:hypothetical protein